MPSPLLAIDVPFAWAGEASAALSALLWGSSGVVFARMRPAIAPAAINLGKNVAATGCFLALLWIVTGSPVPTGLDAKAFLVFGASGFLGLALCDNFLLRSLLNIGPQRMSVIFLTVPVLVALAATLPPFDEHAPWQAWAGMFVCLSGILLAIRRPQHHAADPAQFRRGVRDALLGALFQSAAVLLARYGLSQSAYPLLDSAVVRMAAGTLGLVLLGGVFGGLGAWARALRPPRTAATVFAASFFGTFLGILTNQAGLQWAEHAGVATTLNSLMPIYLIPLSIVFLGERFGARGIVATLVAVAGVALMMLG